MKAFAKDLKSVEAQLRWLFTKDDVSLNALRKSGGKKFNETKIEALENFEYPVFYWLVERLNFFAIASAEIDGSGFLPESPGRGNRIDIGYSDRMVHLGKAWFVVARKTPLSSIGRSGPKLGGRRNGPFVKFVNVFERALRIRVSSGEQIYDAVCGLDKAIPKFWIKKSV